MEIITHTLGSICAHYLHDCETGQISLVLLPAGMEPRYAQRRTILNTPEVSRLGTTYQAWHVGSLCHLALRHHPQAQAAGVSELDGYSTRALRYDRQEVSTPGKETRIVTTLVSEEGYEVEHTLSHTDGDCGVEVVCRFINHTGRTVRLDMLTSFALDNLSPLAVDDGACTMTLHRFYGGWSAEGRRRADTLESLNLERSWFNLRPTSERFGSVGSYPVDRYFPFAALEDHAHHVIWAAQLACNASWQMELFRSDDCVCFAGGLPDCEFGGWYKDIPDGVSFSAPKAFLSVAQGDLQTVCNQITAMHQKSLSSLPQCEQVLPAICNEWCISWGHPSEDEIVSLAARLQGTPVRYLVIDAGWSETNNDKRGLGGNGDWRLDRKKFPNGLLALSKRVQAMGMQLGIWFEFEVTTRGAQVFCADYDDLHLKRGGELLLTGPDRSFWDFRRQEVQAYLKEKVLDFLKSNEITFLKVDYNGSIGAGCDGAENPSEGLRQQMEAVREFFLLLRQSYPELVIENCAAGGHRLEPSMMDITALSSGSDAYGCLETPIVAANTDILILPRQNEIWCVLHQDDAPNMFRYRLASGFLGRLCISGHILSMSQAQWALTQEGLDFYQACTGVLADCQVRVVQALATESIRYPHGLQAVAFSNESTVLLVCHGFSAAAKQEIYVPLPPGNWRMGRQFGDCSCLELGDSEARISGMRDYDAFAVLLEL